jgi:sugar phosphate isomerase/epimerase
MIYYSGFADEASPDIDRQIKATKALGWSYIESRNIDGINIIDLDDKRFDEVCGKLADAEIRINCFGSAVANHATDVFNDTHVHGSLDQMRRAVPRMKRLGTRLIRGMSFALPTAHEPDAEETRSRVLKNLRETVKICEDNDLIFVHENCMCYGGLSSDHAIDLIESINSPAFKLVYDTGNPVFSLDWRTPKSQRLQDSWQFYNAVKEHIYYVHIKDGVFIRDIPGEIFPEVRYTYPGEGDGNVRKIVSDLLSSGYQGGFSIEPHMTIRPGQGDHTSSVADTNYETYIEYGRRLVSIVNELIGR